MFDESCLNWYGIKGGKEAKYHGAYISFFDGAADKGNLPWYASDVSANAEVPEDDEWKHCIEGFSSFMEAIEEADTWTAEGTYRYSYRESWNDAEWVDIEEGKKALLTDDGFITGYDGSELFDLTNWEFCDSDDCFVSWVKHEDGKIFLLEFNYRFEEA